MLSVMVLIDMPQDWDLAIKLMGNYDQVLKTLDTVDHDNITR